MDDRKRLEYQFIKSFVEERNYKILSSEYSNDRKKLLFECPVKHIFEMRFSSFKGGTRCPVCYGNKKLTFEYVKNFIENTGYTILSTEYKNAQTPIVVQCEKKHAPYKVRFYNFQQGKRCPICNKLSIEDIRDVVEKQGYNLISNVYKSYNEKLHIRCNKGHDYYTTFGVIKGGHKCPTCSIENKRLTYNYVRNIITKSGFTLVSKYYINNRDKLTIKCRNNHTFRMPFAGFVKRKQCPRCSVIDGASMIEKNVLSYVKSVYDGVILENDRSVIKNPNTGKMLELDIYLPELNKAIEFNGVYYHNEKRPDVIKRDIIKQKICSEKKIGLMIINETNWMNDYKLCKKKISSFLQKG